MKLKKKKAFVIIVIFLLLIEISSLFLMYKSFSNRNINETKEEYKSKKKMFSMYVENEDGIYEKYEGENYFPSSNYELNLVESSCVDIKGNKVDGILSSKNRKVTVTSRKTVYCTLYFDLVIIEDQIFSYTGNYQIYEARLDGYYYVETWGAQGGTTSYASGGRGAYASGYVYLDKGEKLYIYVGNSPASQTGGYNGGASIGGGLAHFGYGGGGATDIRYFGDIILSENDLLWNSSLGLNSRVMVAAGGGSGAGNTSSDGHGGTLIGSNSSATEAGCGANGGTQTYAGVNVCDDVSVGGFGYGGTYGQTTVNQPGGGGGGGYYGGGGGQYVDYYYQPPSAGAGGSSFISGYAGVNAIKSSSDTAYPRLHTSNTLHYSSKYFIHGTMIAGVNEGNGRARISYKGLDYSKIDSNLKNVRYIKDCTNGNSANGYNHWVELQAIKDGINIAYGKSVSATFSGTYDLLVDGDILTTQYLNPGQGEQCVIVDLEGSYDLDEIAVWHYYGDGRKYNDHYIYVSSDNSTWKTALTNHSQITETSNGIRVNAYDEIKSFYVGDSIGTDYTSVTDVKVNMQLFDKDVAEYYCISSSASHEGCTWKQITSANIQENVTLSSGDGEKRVYGYIQTSEGFIINTSDSIVLDTSGPTDNSISINSGNDYTTSTSVTLTLASTGASEMCISNTSSCTSWETYATSKSWTLTIGNGSKTVYVWFRDEFGNQSSYVTDTIIYDTTAPTINYSLSGGTYNSTQTLTITASDTGGSGFSYMMVHVYKDGSLVASQTTNSTTSSTYQVFLNEAGDWYVYTQVYDKAGNKHTQLPDNGAGWYYQQYIISLYTDAYVTGLSGSYEIAPSATSSGAFAPRITVYWSETYNPAQNTSIVSITDLKFYPAGYSGNFYFGGGQGVTNQGVYINGEHVQYMNYYYGTHGMWVNGTSVVTIASASGTAYPWSSSAISHDSNGNLTIPIRIYLSAVNGNTYANFDNTMYITLTDTR